MKRIIFPAIICLSTLTSLVSKAPANAAINTNSELDNITELTTVETETTPQLESLQVESEAEAEEVAYYPSSTTCYYEYYPDGSYAWVCW
jgi:hypothetical protein